MIYSAYNTLAIHFSSLWPVPHEAGGDEDVPLDLAADVEEQNHEAFHLGVEVGVGADVCVPVAGSLGRAGAFLQFAGQWTFSQGDEPPFLRLRLAAELLGSRSGSLVDCLHHRCCVNRLGHVFLAFRRSGSALFAGPGRARLLRQETRVRRPDGRGPGATAGTSDRLVLARRLRGGSPVGGEKAETERLTSPTECRSTTGGNVGGSKAAG